MAALARGLHHNLFAEPLANPLTPRRLSNLFGFDPEWHEREPLTQALQD